MTDAGDEMLEAAKAFNSLSRRIEIEVPESLKRATAGFTPPFGHVFQADPVRVVGLDLSLTSTGMSDGSRHEVVQTGPYEEIEERLERIIRSVVQFVVGGAVDPPDLVVIEGAAFAAPGTAQHELAAIRLMVRHRLWCLKIPFAMVPPATLKKYITGDGRATKPEMAACVARQYGWDPTEVKLSQGRYDRVDALGLAAMGYDRLDEPIGNAICRESLDAVVWPELLRD